MALPPRVMQFCAVLAEQGAGAGREPGLSVVEACSDFVRVVLVEVAG